MIDAYKAVELLEQAVREKGADYVYKTVARTVSGENEYTVCVYEQDGAPSCMVGYAYFYAGATIDQLRVMDGEVEATIRQAYEDELVPVETTPGAVAVFEAAQTAQDDGSTWGEALERARERQRALATTGR